MPVDEDNETWADAADVTRFTGASVTEAMLIQAQDLIEIFCGFTFLATDNLTERNLRLLNRAVAYQAGWMDSRPDLHTHLEADQSSQAGTSFSKGHENAELLAPLAIRCLRRLTPTQKPLHLRKGFASSDYSDDGPRDSAVADDNRVWVPLP